MKTAKVQIFHSTLPCWERQGGAVFPHEYAGISIHAPVKGATPIISTSTRGCLISIHAPVKGATRNTSKTPALWCDFNPRSREGSDENGYSGVWRIRISIHAPVKGATVPAKPLSHVERDFNPRSREGSDPVTGKMSGWHEYFNPRSREGSDPVVWKAATGRTNFNPRSREGSDLYTSLLKRSSNISIHAPVKGATYILQCGYDDDDISIHAPVKGATCSPWSPSRVRWNFNPRSREGSDIKP